MNQDREHLKLLAIMYYLDSLLCFGVAGVWIAYLLAGILRIGATLGQLPWGGGLATIFGLWGPWRGFVVAILIFALLQFIAAGFLLRGKHRHFCILVAALTCLSVPLGTILGVFTLAVLARSSVVRVFEGDLESTGRHA